MKNPRFKHHITVNNKKHSYFLSSPYEDEGYNVVFFECEAANIGQPFLTEDIPALLVDLPELILEEKEYQKKQKDIIRFRVTIEDKKKIEKRAVKQGYPSVSAFLRDVALGG